MAWFLFVCAVLALFAWCIRAILNTPDEGVCPPCQGTGFLTVGEHVTQAPCPHCQGRGVK